MKPNNDTNEERAANIKVCLATYSALINGDLEEIDLGDMLTDIMHFCRKEGYDFQELLQRAKNLFDLRDTFVPSKKKYMKK